MKKVLSIFLAVTMLFSMSITAFAADNENVARQNIFQISETVKENNNVLRKYTKTESANNSVWTQNDYANTKALLLALGMEQTFIDYL